MCEILKSLGKRKLANFLIFLQIMFSFTYFFTTAASIQKVFHVYSEVPKALNTDKEYIMMAEIQNDIIEGKEFQSFCEDLRREGKIEKIGTYHNTWLDSERMNMDAVYGVEVSRDIDWIKSIEIEDGRGFEPDDFASERASGSKECPLPMLVGQQLVQKYSLQIGEQLSDINGIHYKVVGILKHGSRWFMQTIPEGLSFSLENQVVIPLLENDVQIHYYFKVPDGVVSEEARESIERTADRYQIQLSVDSVSHHLQEQFDADLKENIQWLCFSIIVLLMISIGLTTLIVARMYSRKREIGIRIAVGYTLRQVRRMFVSEVLILVLAGLLSAIAVTRILVGNGMDYWEGLVSSTGIMLTYPIVILGGMIGMLMCIPSTVALFVKFRKLQPKNLIGGKE